MSRKMTYGRIAYEAKWKGFAWALPWDMLPKRVQEGWDAIGRACVVEALTANVELAEQVAFASAALDGADDTLNGLRKENEDLRTRMRCLANTMEAASEVLGSRRKFDADLMQCWSRDIAEARRVARPLSPEGAEVTKP